MNKYYYVAENRYGTNLSYKSIGWMVLRFSTQEARDKYLDENDIVDGQEVAKKLLAKDVGLYIGYGKRSWYSDDRDSLEIGVRGEL